MVTSSVQATCPKGHDISAPTVLVAPFPKHALLKSATQVRRFLRSNAGVSASPCSLRPQGRAETPERKRHCKGLLSGEKAPLPSCVAFPEAVAPGHPGSV